MRWQFALPIFLWACWKPRQVVELTDMTVTVPGDFVPLDEARAEKLRASARGQDKQVEVSLVGRKPPRSPMPWVYLQRTSVRPNVHEKISVERMLELAKRQAHFDLMNSGLDLATPTTTLHDNTFESCQVTKPKENAQSTTHTCVRMWVDAQTKKLQTAAVVCLSVLGEEEECERILKSRVITPAAPLPLENTLDQLYE